MRHGLHTKALRDNNRVVDLKKRKDAARKINDFPKDHLITNLTENAEKIFEPKRIGTIGDWLKSYKEPDQFYKKYAGSMNNSFKWIRPAQNKPYLFMVDDKFKQADIENYMKYAGAFFPGTEIGVVKQDMVVPGQ